MIYYGGGDPSPLLPYSHLNNFESPPRYTSTLSLKTPPSRSTDLILQLYFDQNERTLQPFRDLTQVNDYTLPSRRRTTSS